MKVTLNWLKQYVDFHWSPEELGERLTMLGIEVEGIEVLGGRFDGVVVAQILASEKHPNADKLSVCRVADGKGERQIVCGATNFKVGDKVPLILPGASLSPGPGEKPFTIKVSKMRGVESHGMMCSPKELGLANDASGLLILPADATVGQDLAQHLGQAEQDVVYDLEITPNRPDLNSLIGIAREISAFTGNPLNIPEIKLPPAESGASLEQNISVRIQDTKLCPRYTARIIQGVKIGPSPDWLRQTLEKVGIRSISNVVDVTNFVMLEVGQPLHAFDHRLLNASDKDTPPTIVVRRAENQEKFTTLDNQEHTLTPDQLLIADESKAIALAGVMGGLNTEINDQTSDVLIESAYFNPQNIRATSKKLDLRTESSYRFERGADVAVADWASQRAAQLILETAGGWLLPGVIDAYPSPHAPHEITLRYQKTNDLLGISIPPADQAAHLERLSLHPVGAEENVSGTFSIPAFRVDLKREVDLIEEVGRMHGINEIPSTPPRGATGSNPFDAVHDHLAHARTLLCGLGLNEAQGQTLISTPAASRFEASSGTSAPQLKNPLSSDMDRLRPSLLPGLLDALRHNVHHGVQDVALFEVGRVFIQSDPQLTEERRLAILLTGDRNLPSWSNEERGAKFDVFDLKGILEEFFDRFGVRGVSWFRREKESELYLESATVRLGKHAIGELGQLPPSLAREFDARHPVFLAELNLDLLLARRTTTRSFKSLPSFPASRRDVAMVVPEAVTHETVLAAIRKSKAEHLQNVELFDVFRGQNIPDGKKSVAYAFTYRNPERTLTDNEVNGAHKKVIAALTRIPESELRA